MVTFNVTMDMSPISQRVDPVQWALWIDWGESFNGNNYLTLSDITGITPHGEPWRPWNGSITDGITGSGGMIFMQAFDITDQPMHMTVSLTNNCYPGSVFGCNDGDLMIGIVPWGLFGSDETFLHFAVDRPLRFAVNNQLIGFNDATQQPLFLRPHTSPFMPTPEPATLGLFLIGLVGIAIGRWWKRKH